MSLGFRLVAYSTGSVIVFFRDYETTFFIMVADDRGSLGCTGYLDSQPLSLRILDGFLSKR